MHVPLCPLMAWSNPWLYIMAYLLLLFFPGILFPIDPTSICPVSFTSSGKESLIKKDLSAE